MTMTTVYPVILCGGSGARLWPLSRHAMPKQFLPLVGENSLFQQAALRVTASSFAAPLIITANNYRFIAAQQLADIDIKPHSLLLEPSAKNTAPAILAAAEKLQTENPDAIMLVMPSDHYIPDSQSFSDLILAAGRIAKDDAIVTFGIQPDRPETGYGYIEMGKALPQKGNYRVTAFHEKPNQTMARKMLKQGHYLWNTGVFLVRCRTLLKLAEKLVPNMLSSVKKAVALSTSDLDFLRLDEAAWQQIKAQSIDYAIMEKADNLTVCAFSGRWSDLGDWHAIKRELAAEEQGADANGNLLVGNARQIDSRSCLVWSDNQDQIVTALGLEDTIIVAMKDAVLVMDTTRTQSVRQLVKLLAEQGFAQAQEQKRQFRPWGWFETLMLSDGCQIRWVHLYPRSQLSLQKHEQRTEIFVVTSGVAEVTINGQLTRLNQNQCVDIPAGAAHQLANSAENPLTLIEIRTGDYLGDDDVERLELEQAEPNTSR